MSEPQANWLPTGDELRWSNESMRNVYQPRKGYFLGPPVPLTDAWCRMALATRLITPPIGEGQRSHAGLVLIGAFIALIVVVPWLVWVGGK